MDDLFQKLRRLDELAVRVAGQGQAVGRDVAQRAVGVAEGGQLGGEVGDDPVQFLVLLQGLLPLVHLSDQPVHGERQVLEFVPGRDGDGALLPSLGREGAHLSDQVGQGPGYAPQQSAEGHLGQEQEDDEGGAENQPGLLERLVRLRFRVLDGDDPLRVLQGGGDGDPLLPVGGGALPVPHVVFLQRLVDAAVLSRRYPLHDVPRLRVPQDGPAPFHDDEAPLVADPFQVASAPLAHEVLVPRQETGDAPVLCEDRHAEADPRVVRG